MNILITAPNLNPIHNVSGISAVVQNIIQYNPKHKYFHYLLGRSDKATGRIKWFLSIVKQISMCPYFIKKNKIDVAHQNLPLDPKGITREYLINLCFRIMHIPIILHVHGGIFLMNRTNNLLFRYFIKSMIHHSQRVIVLSEIEKDALIKNYHCLSTDILHNSVDTNLYSQRNEHVRAEKNIFLFLGRINESKGIEEIIEAFKLIKKEMDFRFILCGYGPLKEKMIADCTAILGEDFEYLGVVFGKEKAEVICKSDYFLLPSRYGEGLPMALLETMAAGVVPIVTDDASMKYVVSNGMNGIQVNKRDPNDIAKKIVNILKNSDLYCSLSMNAKKTIMDNYGIENFIYKLNEIYGTILSN